MYCMKNKEVVLLPLSWYLFLATFVLRNTDDHAGLRDSSGTLEALCHPDSRTLEELQLGVKLKVTKRFLRSRNLSAIPIPIKLGHYVKCQQHNSMQYKALLANKTKTRYFGFDLINFIVFTKW